MGARDLRGATALITGAAKRLGRASARALAERGVNIAVHYNNSVSEAQRLCSELSSMGVQAWAVQADLSGNMEDLFDRTCNMAGKIDILVNNASIFPLSSVQDVTYADAIANFQINAWAPFVLSRAFARQQGRGAIINMLDSRLAGYDWKHVGYILSKHVLAQMTKMLALDFAPHVTVNAVAPGLVLPPPGETEEYLDRVKGSVPLQKHGDEQDVAEAVVYLSSCTFTTGQVLFVDGGRHLKG